VGCDYGAVPGVKGRGCRTSLLLPGPDSQLDIAVLYFPEHVDKVASNKTQTSAHQLLSSLA
jgi:hypothetical protein